MISPEHEHLRLQHRIKNTRQRLEKFRNIRLAFGLSVFTLIIVIAAQKPSMILTLIFLALFALLLYFIFASRKINNFLTRLEALDAFSQRQTKRLEGEYLNSKSYQVSDIPQKHQVLCQDLHLFGSHSLYSLLDETLTDGGRSTLARWIYEPLKNTQEILSRQKKVKLLSEKLHHIKKLITLKSSDFQIASKALEAELHSKIVGEQFKRHFYIHLIVFPVIWIWFIALMFQFVSGPLWLPFLIYFFYFIYSKKQIIHNFSKAEEYTYQLKRLTTILEFLEQNFEDPELAVELKNLKSFKPSEQIRKIEKITSALSVQAHPMAYLFFNTILPWDFWWTNILAHWRQQFLESYPLWTKELYDFEALMSLAVFHSYQTQTWPQWTKESHYKVTQLYHPLINRKEVIGNDFDLKSPTSLVLITGSNMSGKSTFLRTIGINQKLALMGAPVFASEYSSSYMQVFSCLQVTDSLDGGISTFYYEVKAIRDLLERARNGEPILYLIDEIFRGTNNRERFIGSQAVIRELVNYPSVVGFISTHDLDLAAMGNDLPTLTNWHFRDDVETNRLSFSYKIQSGPCPSTNALKIMRSEGLPVD